MASVCTGASIYAAAGILAGRRATTHWALREVLGSMGVNVCPGRVVFDEPFVSGAGVSAGIDMALALTGRVQRGLAVLCVFTPDRPALGISELARELALTRSTTHRYVATLASLGFLDQDASTRKYRLGPRVLDLGFSVLGSLELREIAAPYLRRLTDATGHTSNLAIRDNTDVILIDRVRGRPGRYHHLEFTLHVGSRIPAYCSATGKVLLAYLPHPDLEQLLERIDLIQRGPRTVTGRKALLAELDQVRRSGLAVNDEELESALRSIAAPVRARSGEVVAAVNVSIPWSPVTMSELVSRPGPTVQATAHEIAARVI